MKVYFWALIAQMATLAWRRVASRRAKKQLQLCLPESEASSLTCHILKETLMSLLGSYETASGLRATIMLSGGWDEFLTLPEMDVDKAIASAKRSGGYAMPGQK